MGASPVVDVAKPVRARRERGMIERRGGSFRVKVYAGLGLQTGRRLYLTESTSDEREAERIRTRLHVQIDAKRATKVTGGGTGPAA